MGQLADTSQHWVPAFVKLNQLSDKFFNEVWIPERDIGNMRVNLSFTPSLHLHPGRLPAVRRPEGAELLHRAVGADPRGTARGDAAAELSAAQGSDAARGNRAGRQTETCGSRAARTSTRTRAWPIRIRHCRLDVAVGSGSGYRQSGLGADTAPSGATVTGCAGGAGSSASRRGTQAATGPGQFRRPAAAAGRRGRAGVLRRQRRTGRERAGATPTRRHHRSTGIGGHPVAARSGRARHDSVCGATDIRKVAAR